MEHDITGYVGLDVHKDSIAVAVAKPGRAAPHFVGTTGPRLSELYKALSHLGATAQLHLAYEAGPCGYTLAREDAVRARLKARQQLKALLLRHGHRYTGKTSWNAAHERYLGEVSFAHAAQNIAYAEYRAAVRDAHDRVARLEASLREQAETWRFAPVVRALMTLKGIDFVAAFVWDIARHVPLAR
ncbi:MAG: hypothetical protein AB7G76_16165 [Steroidobacteraceae bacterium]